MALAIHPPPPKKKKEYNNVPSASDLDGKIQKLS